MCTNKNVYELQAETNGNNDSIIESSMYGNTNGTEPASTSSASQSTGMIDSSISLTSAENVEHDPLPCTSQNIDQSPILISDETSNIEDLDNTIEEDNVDCETEVQNFGDDELAKKCFFCQKVNKKRKGRQIYCRKIKNKVPFLEKIKNYSTELGDIEFLLKIQEENNSVNDTFLAYHNICYVNYFQIHLQLMIGPRNEIAIKLSENA
ncbi:unnamed protein product [Colias eurytheme]|nr:unnamed protein product [Colias eurytheme]